VRGGKGDGGMTGGSREGSASRKTDAWAKACSFSHMEPAMAFFLLAALTMRWGDTGDIARTILHGPRPAAVPGAAAATMLFGRFRHIHASTYLVSARCHDVAFAAGHRLSLLTSLKHSHMVPPNVVQVFALVYRPG